MFSEVDGGAPFHSGGILTSGYERTTASNFLTLVDVGVKRG